METPWIVTILLSVACLCTHTGCARGQELTLSLGNTVLPNNSVVVITDIGDGNDSALVCTTTFRPCCSTFPNRHGEWYYPDGIIIPNSAAGEDFYRGRSDDGEVRLSRRNNALSPLGTFICELPKTSSDDLQTLAVIVVEAPASEAVTTATTLAETSTQTVATTPTTELPAPTTELPTTTTELPTTTTEGIPPMVSLRLGNTVLPNNSVILVTDIGEFNDGLALICSTTFRPCCSSNDNRHGEWYYPDGTLVPNSAAGEDFYRGRSDDGEVRLSRRNNAISPLGTFICEIPLTSTDTLEKLTVTVTTALVSLSLGNTVLPNNSAVVITDIGDFGNENESALICTTTFRPCCSTVPNRYGEWYYPDGTMVPNNAAGEDFYRGRSDDGEVRLLRRSNALSPLGTFYCELPLTIINDSQIVTQILTVRVVAPPIITTEAVTTRSTSTTESAVTTEQQTTTMEQTTTPVTTEQQTTTLVEQTTIPVTTVTQPSTTDVVTTEMPTTESPVTTNAPSHQVSLSLGNTVLPNNSVVMITDIGDFQNENESTLICTTTFRPCCSTPPNRYGEWYYPDGTMVPNNAAGEDFYRGRSNDGEVRLSRRNNAILSPLGTFYCEIPLNSTDTLERLAVTVIGPPITTEAVTTSTSTTESAITTEQQTTTVVEQTTIPVTTEEQTTTLLEQTAMPVTTEEQTTTVEQTTVPVTTVTQSSTIEVVTTEMPTTQSPVTTEEQATSTTNAPTPQVSLRLGNTVLPNNSVILVTDIGEFNDGLALICSTTFRPCCSSNDNRHGEWYYPDGTMVPNSAAGEDFYRGRSDDGEVRLSRRNNAISPLGTFICEIPLTSTNTLERLTVRVVEGGMTTGVFTAGMTTQSPTTDVETTEPFTTDSEPTITVDQLQTTMFIPDLRLFQLRLTGISNCITWRDSNPMGKASDITDKLVNVIRERCDCEFTSNQITQGGFQCFSDSINSVTYRASIEGDSSTNTEQLLTHLEAWVNSDNANILVQSVILNTDSSCSVHISSLSEAECRLNEGNSLPVGAIAGGAIAGIIVALILLVVLIVIVVYVKRRRAWYKTTFPRGSQNIRNRNVMLNSLSYDNPMHVYDEVPRSEQSKKRKPSISSIKKELLRVEATNSMVMTNPSTGVYEQVDLGPSNETQMAVPPRKSSEPLPLLPDEQARVPLLVPSEYLTPNARLINNPTYGVQPPGVGPTVAGEEQSSSLMPQASSEGESNKESLPIPSKQVDSSLVNNPTYGISPPGAGPIIDDFMSSDGQTTQSSGGEGRSGNNANSDTGDYAVIDIK